MTGQEQADEQAEGDDDKRSWWCESCQLEHRQVSDECPVCHLTPMEEL